MVLLFGLVVWVLVLMGCVGGVADWDILGSRARVLTVVAAVVVLSGVFWGLAVLP